MDIDEASLQRIEEAGGGFVGASDALSPGVTVGNMKYVKKTLSQINCQLSFQLKVLTPGSFQAQ